MKNLLSMWGMGLLFATSVSCARLTDNSSLKRKLYYASSQEQLYAAPAVALPARKPPVEASVIGPTITNFLFPQYPAQYERGTNYAIESSTNNGQTWQLERWTNGEDSPLIFVDKNIPMKLFRVRWQP